MKIAVSTQLFYHEIWYYSPIPLFLASAEENHDSSDKEEGGEIQLEMVELTLGTLDLREYEINPSRHRRRRRRKKEEAKVQNETRSSPVFHDIGGYSYILRTQRMLISLTNVLQGL